MDIINTIAELLRISRAIKKADTPEKESQLSARYAEIIRSIRSSYGNESTETLLEELKSLDDL